MASSKFKISYKFILSIITCICTTACSSDNSETHSTDNSLVGSKWTVTNWDYGLGDDWISIADETCNLYFYSSTEGVLYYGQKEFDSDFGSSSERIVTHFTYNVSGNNVILNYITEPIFDSFTTFQIQGETISSLYNDFEFAKDRMNASDNTWLATLHGTTGTCKWYHNLKNTLWITGEGEMDNYNSYTSTPWARNNRIPNAVIVEEGVTSVGSCAFANPSVVDVDLPSSLEKIGESAFSGSTVSNIDLGNRITEIGSRAFQDCEYLKRVTIPTNTETISDYAFAFCAKSTISLSQCEKLQKIGRFAFTGTTVSAFTPSEVLSEVGTGAFSSLKGSELKLPNSLTRIEAQAFNGSFSSIYIGNNVDYIAEEAFISTATSGKMLVNLSTPPDTGGSIISNGSGFSGTERKWTLYVPKGCKTVYSVKSPWNNFKAIIEDSSLEGNGEMSDDTGGGESENGGSSSGVKVDYKNLTYKIAGKTYKMILVDGGDMAPFYIMQTEVPSNLYMYIGDISVVLNSNADGGIIKSELRSFINKLREATGLAFRLPTTAEWQFAAQGGKKSEGYTYSGSNDSDEVAWHKNNSGKEAHDIATKAPNELGLYDMSGNYREVCNDTDDEYYIDGPNFGGCWNDNPSDCKTSSWKPGSTSANKIPGTNLKELNAVDAKYITIRLVYSIPK